MRPSSRGTILDFEVYRFSWHGKESGQWFALLLMKRESSARGLQCRLCRLSGCARTRFLCLQILRGTVRSPNKVRDIFLRHTDLVEPLSLDEAYLDVTENKKGLTSATEVARTIRKSIRTELELTASAGVAPNKFLAKIASDWRKPDGLFVIRPEEAMDFLAPIAVDRLPGVGKVTAGRLAKLGVRTVEETRSLDVALLQNQFGRYGVRLHELAMGIDNSPVQPDRPTQSISAEDTFESDVPLSETAEAIRRLAEKVWQASRKESRIAHTVVLKLKTADFSILTRSHTPASPPGSCDELTRIAMALRAKVRMDPAQKFHLVGVGLSNFRDPGGAARENLLF